MPKRNLLRPGLTAVLLTAAVACQSPDLVAPAVAEQNARYLVSLRGIDLPFTVGVPNELPPGFVLASSPVVAQDEGGAEIVLFSFTDPGEGQRPLEAVTVCESEDAEAARRFCPESQNRIVVERTLENTTIVVAADTDAPQSVATAWKAVTFQDLERGGLAWADD